MSSGRLEAAHDEVLPERSSLGKWIFRLASALLLVVAALQIADAAGLASIGFADWRPTLYAFLVWCVALGIAQVLERGELGQQRLFVLPALLFTGAMVIFPTLFGFSIAFTDWNLNAQGGHHFNGLDNLRTLWADSYFWNALGNMVFYVATVIVQYAIAFGLALLLNADIRGRKFFRVAFLLPFMLSPVAVELDDRQVAHGKPLRASGEFRQMARLGECHLFHRSVDRPDHHHRHGRVGVDPVHGDPAARGPAGAAAST